MAEIPEVDDTAPSILLPCTSCNRTFRPEALAKHTKVCEKTLMRKRKKFDSAKQRIQGTELAQFLPTLSKQGTKSAVRNEPQSKWKEKDKGGGEGGVTPVKMGFINRKSEPAMVRRPVDYEQCPHCERFFGSKAYDRHVEWCKEQSTRMTTKSQTCLEAKERLEARTKYRAPLNKTQRSLTKEHYSPMRTQHENSHRADAAPVRVHKSPEPSQKELSYHRSPSLSRSLSQRSPTKTNISRTPSQLSRSSSIKLNNRKQVGKESHTQQPQEVVMDKPFQSNRPKVINRGNISEKSDLDKYDPFVSAELQMLELFSEEGKANNNNNVTSSGRKESEVEEEELNGNHPPPPSRHTSLPALNPSPVIIHSSPTSAFAKFTPISPETSPPPLFESSRRRGSDVSLSNLSVCSVVSIDSLDCNRNYGRGLFGRSQSAVTGETGRVSVRHAPKSRPNMHEMLYGQTPLNGDSAKDSVEAELLASMVEFERMLSGTGPPSPSLSPPSAPRSTPLPSSPLGTSNTQQAKNSISPTVINNNIYDIDHHRPSALGQCVDSAYSSLTRKTPVDIGGADSSQTDCIDTARFCHECGYRYPIPAAKFCCHCGIKRITI